MSKKILITFLVMFCYMVSYSQFANVRIEGNSTTIQEFKDPINAKTWLLLPLIDTLNNLATPYAGALTVRPQDLNLYISDGTKWRLVSSNIIVRKEDDITVKLLWMILVGVAMIIYLLVLMKTKYIPK